MIEAQNKNATVQNNCSSALPQAARSNSNRICIPTFAARVSKVSKLNFFHFPRIRSDTFACVIPSRSAASALNDCLESKDVVYPLVRHVIAGFLLRGVKNRELGIGFRRF